MGNIRSSKIKKTIFYTITFLLPVVILASLEGLLRVLGYGGDLRLVRPVEYYDREYFQLNQQVGKRYFHAKELAVPELYPEVFATHKPDNTFRIFFVGGSTTAGFPFEMNARFTSLMEARLNRLFAGRYRFEVINVGMSAINSYTVLDFMHELVNYEPDLFVIYMGHNEFYGALGVGSTEYLGKNRRFIIFYMKLSRLRLFRFLRDGMVYVRRLLVPSNLLRVGATLMENVVRNKKIAYGSHDYHVAKTNYKKNLEEIIDLARTQGAKVLLSTLVCNYRDQSPFISEFSDSTSEKMKKAWENSLQKAKNLYYEDKIEDGLTAVQTAIGIDPNQAVAHYLLGKMLEKQSLCEAARKAYKQAVDYDELRFRASSEWNDIIREVAGQKDVSLVDMEQAFEHHSTKGLIGNELIYEHLHPNFTGYALMADTFIGAICNRDLLIPHEQWPELPELNPQQYAKLAGVTEMDQILADWRIKKLTSRWPFTDSLCFTTLRAKTWQESLAVDYLQKQIPWSDVHYRAARRYEATDQLPRAIAEYRAVAGVRPDAYFPRLRIGTLYLELNQPGEALPWLQQARQLNPSSPAVSYRLGTTHLLLHHLAEAIAALESTLRLDGELHELKPQEKARVHYALGLALIQSRQEQQAISHLEWIEKNQPDFTPGVKLLQKLRKGKKIVVEIGPES